ncbi:MAG: PD-(D/E)XK nuclease family protein [Bacteroidetes bacterium]|nr:PD-(D/E)XK nuclease family protein [Bacteroidota bacterium]
MSTSFYFRYIAGLSEIEELEENMEAATFGKVLHKAMQLIYTDLHGIDEKKLQHLKSSINTFVDQAIHEEFLAIDQLEGKTFFSETLSGN